MMADGHVYEAIIYLFGDLNCHQKHTRSYEINENQMPICARDIGIFSGGTVGFFILFFATPYTGFYRTFFSILPERFQERALKRKRLLFILILILSVVPTGFDGSYQLVSDYESTNFTRITTGFLFGVPVSLAFGAFLMTGTEEVSPEPAGSRYPGDKPGVHPARTSPVPAPAPTPSRSSQAPTDHGTSLTGNENTLIEKECDG